MRRVGDKYGPHARKGLVHSLLKGLAMSDPKAHTALSDFTNFRNVAYDRDDPNYSEEKVASLINYLNNPAERSSYRDWRRERYGENDVALNQIDSHLKRAYKTLRKLARTADTRWLRGVQPRVDLSKLRKSEGKRIELDEPRYKGFRLVPDRAGLEGMNGTSYRADPRSPDPHMMAEGENGSTPRVSMAPSIKAAVAGLAGAPTNDMNYDDWRKYHGWRVYGAKELPEKMLSGEALAQHVPDAGRTGEMWAQEPVNMEYVGHLNVDHDYGQDHHLVHKDPEEWNQELDKASLSPNAGMPAQHNHLMLPVGSKIDPGINGRQDVAGRIKVRHADTGKEGWVEARAGQVLSQDGHAVSARSPNAK